MRAIDRLNRIKEQMQESTTLDKLISLTNPKNVSLMQALVAWTCVDDNFNEQEEVAPDATLDDLWQLSSVNTRQFANTAGLNITQGLAKLKQLRNLGLIFPNNIVLNKALSVVKVYVKGKIEGLS